MEDFLKDARPLVKNSNPGPPVYEAGVLLFTLFGHVGSLREIIVERLMKLYRVAGYVARMGPCAHDSEP